MGRLTRSYHIRGMDRVLYARVPEWPEGTFEQSEDHEGLLRLNVEGIRSPEQLQAAIFHLDQIAEQFTLAVSLRIGCPLTNMVEASIEPHFDAEGVATVNVTLRASDTLESSVSPRAPPSDIEQLPAGAARWIHTLTETRTLAGHPDEVLKRLFLIIEELKDVHGSVLTAVDVATIDELALVRDFVSHPVCDRKKVSRFISVRLPSAMVSPAPMLTVRYDRTNVEHRNFVGRFDPSARGIVNKLLAAAIAALT